MIEPTEDELHRQFDRLRAGDAARSPSFRAMWNRAESRELAARRAVPRIVWWAAAAGVVLAIGIVRYRAVDDSARLTSGAVPATVNRTPTVDPFVSPTAILLRSSRHELLAPPSILSSVLDGATGVPRLPKGD